MISLRQAIGHREQVLEEHKRLIDALDTLIASLQKKDKDECHISDDSIIHPSSEAQRGGSSPIVFPEDWPKDHRITSLRDYILPIAKQHPDRFWTSREIWEQLVAMNVPITGSAPDGQINNVSSVLLSMADRGGPLIQIVKGVGRRPSRYAIRTPAREMEISETPRLDGGSVDS